MTSRRERPLLGIGRPNQSTYQLGGIIHPPPGVEGGFCAKYRILNVLYRSAA